MNTILLFSVLAVVGLVIAVTVFSKPLGIMLKIILKSAIGGIFIIIFNFVSQLFGFYIGVNVLTATITGILGIPGFLMLMGIRLILH